MLKSLRTIALAVTGLASPNAMLAQQDMAGFSMTKSCIGCDFSSASLPMANFSTATFENTSFNDAKLQNADFSNSTFLVVTFHGSDLRGAKFMGSSGILEFSNSDLRGANFSDAAFEADFLFSDLRGANLARAKIDGDFSGSLLSGTNFSGAYFSDLLGEISNVEAPMKDGVKQRRSCSEELGALVHKSVNFSGVSLAASSFLLQGQFIDTDFSNSIIRFHPEMSCKLSLQNSNFNGANITEGNLSGVDLSGSTFLGATVSADLSGTNLENVDFTGAVLTGSNLKGARFCNTTAPDGTIMFDGC